MHCYYDMVKLNILQIHLLYSVCKETRKTKKKERVRSSSKIVAAHLV